MAIARIQAAGIGGVGNKNTITVAFSGNTIAGNHLFAILFVVAPNTVTITPPAGDTWQLATSKLTANPTGGGKVFLYYAENIAGGATNYAWTMDGTANGMACSMMEFSGLVISSLDKTANNAATDPGSTSPDTGTTPTTTIADELWFGGYGVRSTSTFSLPSNGFTLERTDVTSGTPTSNAHSAEVYKIVSATGTADCTSTLSAARDWAGVIGTFKASGMITGISSITGIQSITF